ncbi:ABC transporter ATP-binding protein [Paenibacillus chitinolyticus]|uniref:ABC transporter ATP-binding protein n=1 Tax=Paenibacillus chitinolyticus TaxID=79263 RepID=UPI002DBAC38E|nr:ABC transporter ATP-binding protein [Paenibacillus chitinolyticus]MEC0245216.1 ABC transporter ATP-binding protein [Paenibacillus chitinolyticus]
MASLLSVRDLKTSFFTREGEVQSVRGVSFTVEKGEMVGIVGESGSGKSVAAKSLIRLIQPPGKIVGGEVALQGTDTLRLPEEELRKLRGNRVAMIFQDPMTSLNPVVKVGAQLTEVIRRHRKLGCKAARLRAIELLREVGIPSPEKRIDQYPHEFSGGMRQRVMIAMAISCRPELLIADEPTTALDVTIQAQILDLMKNLCDTTGTSVLLITHDLGVVAQVCTRVVVMYGGLVMEEGPVEAIFETPLHPYTQGLLRSIPKTGGDSREKLVPIEGTPPNLLDPPPGCPFMERCPHAMEKCLRLPPYYEAQPGHRSLCWLTKEAGLPGSRDSGSVPQAADTKRKEGDS